MPSDRQQLLEECIDYDAKVDIVACFEVFFAKSESMSPTVVHFERFPRYDAPDGNEVSPDFTVLFEDGTLLVGEISNLARDEHSLEDLLRQIGRYDTLARGPSAARAGGGHDLADVAAVDVAVLIPEGDSNAACDRINAAIQERRYGYDPRQRPTVLGWGYDARRSRYHFKYDDRSSNPRPRTHGREPTITSWLEGQSDTLRCSADHFAPVKLRQRFMNDRPPALYTAAYLWLDALPALAPSPPPVDLEVSTADLVEYMRRSYGWSDTHAVNSAMAFLERAGLARPTAAGWALELKEIASAHAEVRDELLRRYLAKPAGPVTAADRKEVAERAARDEAQREGNERAQGELEL